MQYKLQKNNKKVVYIHQIHKNKIPVIIFAFLKSIEYFKYCGLL